MNKEKYYNKMALWISGRIPIERIKLGGTNESPLFSTRNLIHNQLYKCGVDRDSIDGLEIYLHTIDILKINYKKYSDQLEKDPYLCSMKELSIR